MCQDSIQIPQKEGEGQKTKGLRQLHWKKRYSRRGQRALGKGNTKQAVPGDSVAASGKKAAHSAKAVNQGDEKNAVAKIRAAGDFVKPGGAQHCSDTAYEPSIKDKASLHQGVKISGLKDSGPVYVLKGNCQVQDLGAQKTAQKGVGLQYDKVVEVQTVSADNDCAKQICSDNAQDDQKAIGGNGMSKQVKIDLHSVNAVLQSGQTADAGNTCNVKQQT